MGANNADFQQPITVYRGLYMTKPAPNHPLGVHWTDNADVARMFASHQDYMNERPEDARSGTVLEAHVSPEHEIAPGTREHSEAQFNWGVFPEGEEERTIRPGAPIRVTRHHYIKDGQIIRSEDVDYEGKA